MVSGLSVKSRKSTAAKNQTFNHTQPLFKNKPGAKAMENFTLSPLPVPANQEQGLKQVIMYKQFVALAKKKDGEDSDEEAYQEEERKREEYMRIKRQRDLNRPRTPVL